MSSLAARRRPQGLTVATKSDRKAVAIQKRIEEVPKGQFAEMFKKSAVIHDGGEQCRIFKMIKEADSVEYVVKVQQKKRIRGANQAIFRRMTERMMNLPESENVIRVFGCYEDAEYFYTIMESCNGGDLFDFFRMLISDDMDDATLEKEVRVVMREILASLNFLHQKGLVHKDVKLENLVFKQQGGVAIGSGGPRSPGAAAADEPGSPKMLKLIDFDFTDEWEPSSPKSKAVVGTDGYIAPEAYLGDVCPGSDIFSAAVIMYILVAGRFPYNDDIFDDGPNENYVGSPKMQEIYEKLRRAAPKVRYGRSWDNLPEAAEFCKLMMEFDVNKRPTAEELLQHPWILAGAPAPA